ncbi:MAG: excinuclease ABC subunit UvrC [Sedimentisphaerales bacterium]|nr:excinuclease ABC subunit UvrC [Sedimentisphaerales bacterium]HOH63869.1 excinuclease ABC subunit UvrC [Sedimentisphaerales bacterium]HPY49624.1 excinuclease ABC subunit UvrC [Sedimentisphaerales bacterium]HQA92023.1 excinuclease ABC subunit UvrC [Sedimentisphaerales bacterium]
MQVEDQLCKEEQQTMGSAEKERLERIRTRIRELPTAPGVYFLKGADDVVLYIGKAKSLRSRVASYFQPGSDLAASRGPKIVEMAAKVCTVDFLETENEVDAMLKEARLIKDVRPPYNTDLTDDKTFPYLEITTREDFPGVYITRKPQARGTRLFGPFANVKDLRAVLVELQKIFRFRTCSLEIRQDDPKRRFFRPCLLYSIKQCTAPCGARIDKADYRKVVQDFIRFLRSKRSTVLRWLRERMEEASNNLEYEKAALFRDRIHLIEALDDRGTPDEHVQPEVFAVDPTEALVKLRDILQSPNQVRIIEGIDIANLSGQEAVGSLVKFIDGRPFKSGYRRFKIKTVAGIDDYAMIGEVVRRRYKYALRGEELWPDLILIDGGLGHLHAAEGAFHAMLAQCRAEGRADVEPPHTKMASIAKREEDIYIQGQSQPLKLAAHSPVRKLLQYVRDEAHRFAQHYHHILRDKKMFDEG